MSSDGWARIRAKVRRSNNPKQLTPADFACIRARSCAVTRAASCARVLACNHRPFRLGQHVLMCSIMHAHDAPYTRKEGEGGFVATLDAMAKPVSVRVGLIIEGGHLADKTWAPKHLLEVDGRFFLPLTRADRELAKAIGLNPPLRSSWGRDGWPDCRASLRNDAVQELMDEAARKGVDPLARNSNGRVKIFLLKSTPSSQYTCQSVAPWLRRRCTHSNLGFLGRCSRSNSPMKASSTSPQQSTCHAPCPE